MRILIDGMDLSGKTTLARRLTRRLQDRGLRVHHTRLTLHDGLHARLARMAYRTLPPGHLLGAWAFALAAVVDRIVDAAPQASPHDVHIHEAHAAHTVAYAAGFGHRRTAALLHAARRLWPRFDHTLLLTAHHATRRARLAARPENNANDMLLEQEPARFQSIDDRLRALLVALGATVIDTDDLDLVEVERAALTAIARVPSPVSAAGARSRRRHTVPESAG